MKPQKYTVKVAPKGDRLNWTPLKDVKPVVLRPELTEGRMLDNKLNNLQKNTAGLNLFVP